MKKVFFLAILPFLALCTITSLAAPNRAYTVSSPNGKIKVGVSTGSTLKYYVVHEQDAVVALSPISLTLSGGEVLGNSAVVTKALNSSVNTFINASFYKRNRISDHYNELVLNFQGNYALTFRVYNEGVAYRFSTARKDSITIKSEQATFNFDNDYTATVPYVNQKAGNTFEQQFFNSFENTYKTAPLSRLDERRLCFLPMVVALNHGKKLCITEADLESYPGMYLNRPAGSHRLEAVMATVPQKMQWGGHNNLQELVLTRNPYIAKCAGTRTFPWRVMAVSTRDAQLADNDLVYKLAAPSRLAGSAWVKPGKVAWDWWNDWNITGVDFKSGVNNATYKYYIDFASKYHMEYVILDEGWAVNGKADLMQVVPEIDIAELIAYAKQRNVGIILWAGYNAFNRDMDKVARHYAGMGVKGFKIDFMDRDDQRMVDFYYRAAKTCAKYKLMADFHGAYKPTGLNRTYPNVVNFEGVHGLEQMKWSADTVDQVTYDVTIPFIRMLAGPMDYTQGAMRNATKKGYYPDWSNPMSQGTRCRQLAEYVVFESPLNMLCDNPSNYIKEPECTAYISSVPKVWDETVALDGAIGQYVAIARKKGTDWYVGAMTNWTGRDMVLDLSFLPGNGYQAEIFADGVNASRNAMDYKHNTITVPDNKKLTIKLAPGGGFTARIFKR